MTNSDVIRAIINAHIKTNRKQEITGKILNSVLNQMVTDKDAGISEEAELRAAEDGRIEGLINKEIGDRESADTEIQDALTKEINARQEGDAAINNSLSEEVAARKDADTTINNALAEEKTAREEGDTSLLNAIRDAFSKGYLFAGVATTDTNPGTPDAKVFYIANGKGTYEKFGGLEVTEDDVVVLYYDTAWHKVSTGIASQEKLTELGREVHKNPFIDNGCIIEMYVNSEDIIVDDLHITKRNASGVWQLNFFGGGSSSVITNSYSSEEEASGIIPVLNAKNNYRECGYIIIDWSKVEDGVKAPVLAVSNNIYNINNSPRINNLLQEKYNSARSGYFPTYGKHIAVLGDSITYGIASSASGLKDATTTYAEKLTSILGAELVNGKHSYGLSGTCISSASDQEQELKNLSFVNRVSSIATYADIIIVAGGTNDFGQNVPLGSIYDNTDTSFYGSLEVLCKRLIERFNGKKIIFITPIQRTEQKNRINCTLQDYRNAIIEVAGQRYSFPIIDGLSLGFSTHNETFKAEYIADGLHPTDKGHILLGENLAMMINGAGNSPTLNKEEKPIYVEDTPAIKELYIFDNSDDVVDLHITYKNHNGQWFLKFFNNVDSTGITVAQTDVYTEEPNGVIPIYKSDGTTLSNIIGYIDVNWSDIPNGAIAFVKKLLPAAFDEYSNPNISNILSNDREKYDLKNIISLNDLSQNTASAVWNLDGDVYKMTTYKGNGNALYKSIVRSNPIIPSGHKFYFCENLKADGVVRFIAQIDATTNSVSIHSGNGEFEFMSNILTINYSGGGNSLLITAARIEQQVSVVEVKDLMMIDLTAVFGKGKEPTKDYMDFYFQNRVKPFYGSKDLFSADKDNVKMIEDRVNDILVTQNAYAQGIVTADMFTNPNKSVLANYINTAMYNFVYVVNKAGDISYREVLASDTIETICDKVNYSMRKDILFVGMSYDAMANAINKRASERIFRFADAKPLSDAPRNFNINTGIEAGEPSAIVSEDGSTLYLYAYLKRYKSKDGVNWSAGEYLKCNGVNMEDKSGGNYLMHCNVNLINGTYYLFGCRDTTGGDLLLYTSTDGINFTHRGTALAANHKVGDYECKNWGNSYLVYDYGSGYYYLYVEFEDSTIHWSTAVFRSTNPINGSWVNAKEDVIIPPAYQGYNPKSNRFGSGNFDFVKGMDNQPIKSNGRYYAYYHGSCYDAQGTRHYNQSNVMRAYSYNLIDWIDEGVILDVRKRPTNGDNTSGNADHCVIEFKGKSYMFYTHDINNYPAPEHIHALIDDRPFSELLKMRP